MDLEQMLGWAVLLGAGALGIYFLWSKLGGSTGASQEEIGKALVQSFQAGRGSV